MTVNTNTATLGSDGNPDPESTTKLVVVKRDAVEFVAAYNDLIKARAEIAILSDGTYIKVSDVVPLTGRTTYMLNKHVGEDRAVATWRQCSLVEKQYGVWPAFMPIEHAMAAVRELSIDGGTLELQFLRAIKRTADAAREGKFKGVWANELPATKWKKYEKLLRKKQEEEETSTTEEEPEEQESERSFKEKIDDLYFELGQSIAEMQKARTRAEEICREIGIAPPWAR